MFSFFVFLHGADYVSNASLYAYVRKGWLNFHPRATRTATRLAAFPVEPWAGLVRPSVRGAAQQTKTLVAALRVHTKVLVHTRTRVAALGALGYPEKTPSHPEKTLPRPVVEEVKEAVEDREWPVRRRGRASTARAVRGSSASSYSKTSACRAADSCRAHPSSMPSPVSQPNDNEGSIVAGVHADSRKQIHVKTELKNLTQCCG